MFSPDFTLDQYAVTSCPVKTQNAFDPHLGPLAWAHLRSLSGFRCRLGLADRTGKLPTGGRGLPWSSPVSTPPGSHGRTQEPLDAIPVMDWSTRDYIDEVVRALVGHHGDQVADLRAHIATPDRIRACRQAMTQGVPIIIGGRLPTDWSHHRQGTADLLIRGEDDATGRPIYHPGIIRRQPILTPAPPGQGGQLVASLAEPFLHQACLRDCHFRVESNSTELIQLAHLWCMIDAAGFAGDRCWGAVVGTCPEKKGSGWAVGWVDLRDKQIRTFSYAGGHQWKKYSPFSRYGHEHRFRVQVALRAMRRTGSGQDPGLLASPVHTPECGTCLWWPACRDQMDDDISVTIERSPLDPREVMTLRRLGVTTTADLAAVDVDALLPVYLPRVAHRPGAEQRLRLAAHRGRLITDGVSLERLTSGPITLPRADVEIDLDIETSAHSTIYLWGFLIHDRRDPGNQPWYQPIGRFAAINAGKEVELAEEATGWLRDFVTGLPAGVSTLVWHYSSYETFALHRLAKVKKASRHGPLVWAEAYARDHFVDLLPVVKENFFGVNGLSLKKVAVDGAGFSWRDPEPDGLKSQFWFADAVRGSTDRIRRAARIRVLEYNEDDVRATWALRRWLRSLT